MTPQVEPLITVAELDCLPDDGNRYELIEGELFVSTAPGLPHQRVAGNLYFSLRSHLKENPSGEVILTPGVIFSEYSAVIPDLVYVNNDRAQGIIANNRFVAAPDLVIEIVSPGKENEDRDRVVKRQAYGKYGVKEYWIVDPQQRTVEVYRLKGRTLRLTEQLSQADELRSTLLPGYRCQVASLFSP